MSLIKTQTEEYWENLQIEQTDIDHLYNILLEKEEPLSINEMALVLVRYRVEQDQEDTPQQKSKQRTPIIPANHIKLGMRSFSRISETSKARSR